MGAPFDASMLGTPGRHKGLTPHRQEPAGNEGCCFREPESRARCSAQAKERKMTLSKRAMLVIAMALGVAMTLGPAQSQTPRSETPKIVPQERQSQPTRPEDSTGPQQGTSAAPSGSLSDELSRSGGVVRPPATGDQGVVEPPKAGSQSTPVIPPPGTPGGNQEIQPK